MAFGALCASQGTFCGSPYGVLVRGDISAGMGGGALRLIYGPGRQSNPKAFLECLGRGQEGPWGIWTPQPPCLEGMILLGGWTPTFEGRTTARCYILVPRQGALEMFRADRAMGSPVVREVLLEEGTYTKDLSVCPPENPSATPPSASSHTSSSWHCFGGYYCLVGIVYHPLSPF